MLANHPRLLTFAAALLVAAVTVNADTPTAALVVRPESPVFVPVPQLAPGIRAAALLGNPALAGPYALRVRLPAGSHIPPHTHPDARLVTVLSGEYGLGLGAEVALDKLQRLPAGSVALVPAGVVHYAVAASGDVEYQESGIGPSGMAFVAAGPPQ